MKQSLPTESERQQNNRTHLTVSNTSPISQPFVNNRESSVIQRQLMAKMASSPQAIALRKFSEQIHNSSRMTAQRKQMAKASGGAVQRVEGEEELMQGKLKPIQRVEEEELLQGQFNVAQRVEEEELLQGKFATVQRVKEEELVQGKFDKAQLEQALAEKVNNTGLPDNLKQGIENLPGMSMDNVKVHYNSSKPAQLNALAYAQGTDIHLGSGQEKYLPHEAWHVVQQAQGRVKPTMQMKDGVPAVSDDQALEHEVDVMEARAASSGVVQGRKELDRLVESAPVDVTEKKENNTGLPGNLQTGAPVFQPKYYNASTNKMTERPDETKAITDKKDKAKKDKPLGLEGFTAHHKYPWNKIAVDIESAFVAPQTTDSKKTLTNLEIFSGKQLSDYVKTEDFLKSEVMRPDTYNNHETKIDEWLSEVCWIPKNIFIGPLANARVDDPGKREEAPDDFDAHYNEDTTVPKTDPLRRRMTARSEELRAIFDAGGFKDYSAAFKASKNDVGEMIGSEWQEHAKDSMGQGDLLKEKMYSQVSDPYMDKNYIRYKTPAAIKDYKYHGNEYYSFEVFTGSDVTVAEVNYENKTLDKANTITAKKATSITSSAGSSNAEKKWTVIFKVPKLQDKDSTDTSKGKLLMIYNKFEMKLTKTSGKEKRVPLDITIKPDTTHV